MHSYTSHTQIADDQPPCDRIVYKASFVIIVMAYVIHLIHQHVPTIYQLTSQPYKSDQQWFCRRSVRLWGQQQLANRQVTLVHKFRRVCSDVCVQICLTSRRWKKSVAKTNVIARCVFLLLIFQSWKVSGQFVCRFG